MAHNSAVLVRSKGKNRAEVTLKNVPVTMSARGEHGASEKGAKNEALIAEGNVRLNAEGGRITATAGRPPTEDAETIKMKAKLIEILPGVPADKIDDLVQELKDDFGVYRADDLKELDDEDLDKIKSIVGVSKKKFKKFIKST